MHTEQPAPGGGKTWTTYINCLIASEISTLTRYYDRLIQWMPRKEDNLALYQAIDVQTKQIVKENDEFPDLHAEEGRRSAILLNGVFNHHFDIEGILTDIKPKLSRTSRLVVVLYNPYLTWLYILANWLGLRKGPQPTTFITRTDLNNLTRLTGYNIVRTRTIAYLPFRLLGIGDLLNRIFSCIPLLKWLSFSYIVTLQPVLPHNDSHPSLSIVIPARNEKGNIENALRRLPELPCAVEVIFVEGNSTDNTWQEIQRVVSAYSDQFNLVALQQTGKGKGDAVRLGFSKASGDLLTILDADLTMPPELLGRFYDAYCNGHADFINGSRLVYPMEGEAMRFLNRIGNIFFARTLSWILDTSIGDSLCGTKLIARHDYERIIRWRKDFGDFDPFGDFELIFPALVLGLGVIDIPIRYRARTYGETNIHRFRHGLLLLKMVTIGLLRIKLGFAQNRKSSNS